MMPEPAFSETEEMEFREFLHNQIREFNNRHSPPHRRAREPGAITPLNLILKDEAGNFLGGLTGNTFWDWLEIDDFYLPPALRGSGTGARLLRRAEEIAAGRGCRHCFLSTFEFQARTFYEQHGYRVVGTLADYPPGSAFYWMRKDF